ncbi:6-hydroxymethylpterin diphosphokinase MptE-like protein [Tissierella sp.]|uniref:motility associated factor glycosyltransferase family protein n=1 Tax=Tissierella sp. TaxID=41274 RepID=UPI0030416449
MILIDNINILKEAYPITWDKIKELEKSIDTGLIQFEDTKQSCKTLYMERNGRKSYLHSKYNPIREAEAIVDEYKDVSNSTTVIFYGTGLGYHIDLFLEKYPDLNYYIYEPIPELLFKYLSYKPIKKLSSHKLKDIVLGNDENGMRKFISQFIDKSNKDIIHVCLNSHINLFQNEYKRFLDLFKEIIVEKRNSLGIELNFQKRWIINSMKNFGDILSTPNILIEQKGQLKGKPALLVAAGPSLNEEIENIRYIKENGLAYIFSVGSAINTLLHHNIYPDAVCTYDPKPTNYQVYKVIIDKEIEEIAMIFGSSVGYETLTGYSGDKYHMITSQDTVSNYYLKNKDNTNINIVFDALSIAVVTIQLLYELGVSPIILVGQNLAYRGEKTYSEGISYRKDLTEEQKSQAISVKDVYGNEILTNEGFNFMRRQMEHYIKILPNIEVINTTKDGADIEGTKFIELEEVITTNLKEKIVDNGWLTGKETSYDKYHLKLQSNKMDREYSKVSKINKEYRDILDKIERVINNRNFPQAEKLYFELDKRFRKIENNDYYKTFILPMNRVEYKILANSIDRLNEECNPIEKGKRIVEKFRNFINVCSEDIEMLDSIYGEMKENIDRYTGG